MNTNDLRDEIQNKLNPSMLRAMFGGPSDEQIAKQGRYIEEIPEVEEEDSYGSEDEDDEDQEDEGSDEESKNNTGQKHSKKNSNIRNINTQ